MRSCGLLFSWMRSLISDSVLPAGHSRHCFPKCSGSSVSYRRRNRFGYLSHSLVCLSSVSWHTYSTESSAWSIQDLPRPSLHPYVSFLYSRKVMKHCVTVGFSTGGILISASTVLHCRDRVMDEWLHTLHFATSLIFCMFTRVGNMK